MKLLNCDCSIVCRNRLYCLKDYYYNQFMNKTNTFRKVYIYIYQNIKVSIAADQIYKNQVDLVIKDIKIKSVENNQHNSVMLQKININNKKKGYLK